MDFTLLDDLVSSSIAVAGAVLIFMFIVLMSLVYLFLFLGGAGDHHDRKPPEPSGAWPVLGHLRLLRGPKLLHVALSEMADKHGPIFGIRLGLRPAIVVSNWELVKELSTTHDLAVASRPLLLAGKHLGYNYAMFAFSPYGSYWREIRKFVSLELLSTRRLNLLGHIRMSETKASIQQLYKLWMDKRDNTCSTGHVLVEMSQWISDFTTNLIFMIIFGKRYTGDNNLDKEKALKCQMIFKKFTYLMGVNVLGDAIPWLRWLDIGGHEKAMKQILKEYDHILVEFLKEHNDLRRESKVESDFMNVMISMLKDANIDGYDADTINKSTCSVLNVAGAHTTASMLTWTISLVMNHPNVLMKVEEELDINVGKGRNVEESDIPNLVYLQAVFKESLRLYPPAPLGAPREVTRDFVVGGYHVAAGTKLILNIWKLQRDPKIWSEPLEFRPERFMATDSNIDVRGQNFELIPFGTGRRVCPGINFSMQMGHLVLASLLHSFQLSNLNNDKLVDMTETEGFAMSKATPLEVIITPKLSSHLYEI